MRNLILAAIGLTAALAGPAVGADIGSSVKDGPADFSSPSVSWTGIYLGGRLGYGHANHNLTVDEYRNGIPAVVCGEGDEECTPQDAVPGETFQAIGINGIDTSGVTGGAQLGFDLQRGRFLFGIVGSYDLSGAETTVSLGGLEAKAIEKGDEWSLGGRLGFLVNPRTLTYALASYTESEFGFAGIGENGATKDVTFSGVTVGAGIEYALTHNVFLGIEGTHTFYGKERIADSGNGEPGSYGDRLNDEIDETKVMGTLKIKLNGGSTGLGF